MLVAFELDLKNWLDVFRQDAERRLRRGTAGRGGQEEVGARGAGAWEVPLRGMKVRLEGPSMLWPLGLGWAV